jgi:UDP-N-acetylglucosamine--N-acetylmuramyl-(pentapeptide) pyrophosphoryl-undecaprenol N-acetylglucosamine transferase
MFAGGAKAFTSVFRATATVIPGTVRTGQPIRRELREAALAVTKNDRPGKILVTGGSQGAAALNELVLSLKVDAEVTLVCGPKNYESLRSRAEGIDLRAFLSADEMAEAYRSAALVIGRSGGSCAEFAAFRLPSVLVPLPTSADDHQRVNAREFSAMRAAVVVEQANPVDFDSAVAGWLNDPERVATARHNLEEWDCPNATSDIVNLLFR